MAPKYLAILWGPIIAVNIAMLVVDAHTYVMRAKIPFDLFLIAVCALALWLNYRAWKKDP